MASPEWSGGLEGGEKRGTMMGSGSQAPKNYPQPSHTHTPPGLLGSCSTLRGKWIPDLLATCQGNLGPFCWKIESPLILAGSAMSDRCVPEKTGSYTKQCAKNNKAL